MTERNTKNFEPLIEAAIKALKGAPIDVTEQGVSPIADIISLCPEAIPPVIHVLGDLYDDADLPLKKSIATAVSDIVRTISNEDNNFGVSVKLDLLAALKETSLSEIEFIYKAMLYSVAADATAVSEFCQENGESGIAKLRDVFKGVHGNLPNAVEGIITHAQNFQPPEPQ